MTIISDPAGFGKTILAVDWLAQSCFADFLEVGRSLPKT
jgi:ATP/maltotriose-dependent transcriptional regulator MalT